MFHFSTIYQYWTENYNFYFVEPVFLPCIRWHIAKYFQLSSVVHLHVATAVNRKLCAFHDQGR